MPQTSANNPADVTTEPHDSRICPANSRDQQFVCAEVLGPESAYPEAGRASSSDLSIQSDLSADRTTTSSIAQASSVAHFIEGLWSSPPLGSALRDFRALLALSWTPDTAVPGTPTLSERCAGRPHGQCGVSSLLLSQILDREYSIYSMLCRGEVYFGGPFAERLRNHCWLEIDGDSEEPVILDLTCDQADTFGREIVFNSRGQLDRENVHYTLSEHIDVFDLPRHSNLWRRYQTLLANMLTLAPSRFRVWLPLIAILRENAAKAQGSATKSNH